MRHVSYSCDRCGGSDDGYAREVDARHVGDLPLTMTMQPNREWHLCGACYSGLIRWVETPPARNPIKLEDGRRL